MTRDDVFIVISVLIVSAILVYSVWSDLVSFFETVQDGVIAGLCSSLFILFFVFFVKVRR